MVQRINKEYPRMRSQTFYDFEECGDGDVSGPFLLGVTVFGVFSMFTPSTVIYVLDMTRKR